MKATKPLTINSIDVDNDEEFDALGDDLLSRIGPAHLTPIVERSWGPGVKPAMLERHMQQ
jgi:hypothetical protein